MYDRAPDRDSEPTTYNPASDTFSSQARQAPSNSTETGDQITVVRGDTLYGLSRRHGVSVNALMDANNLRSSMLRPGQTLTLPSGASRQVATSTRQSSTPVSTQSQSVAAPTDAPAEWSGTYKIEPGDSLYTIARRYGVRSAELQSYNGISDPRRLRPGTVLKVPGNGSASDTGRYASAPITSRSTRSVAQAETAKTARQRIIAAPRVMAPSSPDQPAILNGNREQRVAALSPNAQATRTDASPSSSKVKTVNIRPPSLGETGATTKLKWPARGKIISSFGKRSD
ncbi:MAG: LysM peptidoglycan-binding domain-containing protein, partial [Pseudomonadota bacterium]